MKTAIIPQIFGRNITPGVAEGDVFINQNDMKNLFEKSIVKVERYSSWVVTAVSEKECMLQCVNNPKIIKVASYDEDGFITGFYKKDTASKQYCFGYCMIEHILVSLIGMFLVLCSWFYFKELLSYGNNMVIINIGVFIYLLIACAMEISILYNAINLIIEYVRLKIKLIAVQ